MKLFSSYSLGPFELNNRMVMAPMTRCRAIGNIPNDLMAEYYSQRASAGLIITEGTAPSPNGQGYARIPGIYNQDQINGWRLVTDAVHAKGGTIFLQIMHTGRVSHPHNMPEGARIVAPSAIEISGTMYTDQEGPQAHPVAEAMTAEDVLQAQEEILQAAKNAIEAGFDGVELHSANGYLMEQFLHPAANQRTDNYGGSAENRNRFVIETAQKVVDAIGAERTGIRLSPHGAFNDTGPFEGADAQFTALATALGGLNLAYIHLVDHSAMGAPPVPGELKATIRDAFGGTIIAGGGMDKDAAEALLEAGTGHLVYFGRPFISNPDLVHRYQNNLEVGPPNFDLFYTPGAEGYTDYAVAEGVA